MDIKIRKATIKDWPAIERLSREYRNFNLKIINKIDRSFRVVEAAFDKKAFMKLLRKKNKYYIVVFNDGKMVGFALARVYDWKANNRLKIRFGELSEIFLIKKYRGRGIADMIFKEFYGWFKIKEIDFLRIRAMTANKHAINVYKRWGFKPWVLSMCKKF
ncbi:GNAT family N-acetyltransferase [Patescibacteria group bacterium]|nr:GNAT family N-acetyltransferase [Patescibacteria group bacterium]MBU1922274.1 GNAT family N-acetyltransferase [Patescibacteria group bacterium]